MPGHHRPRLRCTFHHPAGHPALTRASGAQPSVVRTHRLHPAADARIANSSPPPLLSLTHVSHRVADLLTPSTPHAPRCTHAPPFLFCDPGLPRPRLRRGDPLHHHLRRHRRAAAPALAGGRRDPHGPRDAPAAGGAAPVRPRAALLPLGLFPGQGLRRRRLPLHVQQPAGRCPEVHRRRARPHARGGVQEARGDCSAHPLSSARSAGIFFKWMNGYEGVAHFDGQPSTKLRGRRAARKFDRCPALFRRLVRPELSVVPIAGLAALWGARGAIRCQPPTRGWCSGAGETEAPGHSNVEASSGARCMGRTEPQRGGQSRRCGGCERRGRSMRCECDALQERAQGESRSGAAGRADMSKVVEGKRVRTSRSKRRAGGCWVWGCVRRAVVSCLV
eukprot:scaffold2615_cov116-Isochrysis_galbana.AAC.1